MLDTILVVISLDGEFDIKGHGSEVHTHGGVREAIIDLLEIDKAAHDCLGLGFDVGHAIGNDDELPSGRNAHDCPFLWCRCW